MIENVFTFNGPMACSSAKALVLAHVTRIKKRIVAPLKFPISVFLWEKTSEISKTLPKQYVVSTVNDLNFQHRHRFQLSTIFGSL